ncbi:MAG TPA: alkaline phosphatase family protein, partial [Abditibacteriaceae bacterium]|nr:alkaline phosphatase family protein [Abditibacteriaceae bacterium]
MNNSHRRNMFSWKKVQCALAFSLAASVVVASKTDAQAAPVKKPVKLAVVIVVDQMRADYLQKYGRFFGPDGFKRLMNQGANLQNAHYLHATTYTGPGHALILSGTYGHTSGIIGNRWYNRANNRVESMFFDPDAKLLGLEAVPKDDDTSPRNFIGNNLSDQLRLSNNLRSKVVAVANKDRAAIMLAGKLGKAFWYHEGVGGMTSSTFYGADLPAWVKTFNARKIPDSFFGQTWNRALPAIEYSISRADNDPNETDFRGLGKTFPHTLSDPSGKPTASFYEGFTATPFANDYQFAFAREAIAREGLGTDNDTD